MSHDSNILIYFLISNLAPPTKIFELINSANQEAYVQALEIFQNYVNLQDVEDFREKRMKIPSENNHAFHIYITKEELIFISFSNTVYLPTELNFDLFEEINEYLKTEVNRKINESQSFLIEEEKDDKKDELNLKNGKNDDNSKGKLLKNTIVISGSRPIDKPKNVSFRQSLKMKHLSKTVKLDKTRVKNKIQFKVNEKNIKEKNDITNSRKYELLTLMSNKSNNGYKIFIIVILAFIVAIEVIATILIIYFHDYIK